MTRPSKRALEKAVEDLQAGASTGRFGRPEPLTDEERRALDELFSVDTDDIHGPPDPASEWSEFLAALEAME